MKRAAFKVISLTLSVFSGYSWAAPDAQTSLSDFCVGENKHTACFDKNIQSVIPISSPFENEIFILNFKNEPDDETTVFQPAGSDQKEVEIKPEDNTHYLHLFKKFAESVTSILMVRLNRKKNHLRMLFDQQEIILPVTPDSQQEENLYPGNSIAEVLKATNISLMTNAIQCFSASPDISPSQIIPCPSGQLEKQDNGSIIFTSEESFSSPVPDYASGQFDKNSSYFHLGYDYNLHFTEQGGNITVVGEPDFFGEAMDGRNRRRPKKRSEQESSQTQSSAGNNAPSQSPQVPVGSPGSTASGGNGDDPKKPTKNDPGQDPTSPSVLRDSEEVKRIRKAIQAIQTAMVIQIKNPNGEETQKALSRLNGQREDLLGQLKEQRKAEAAARKQENEEMWQKILNK